MSEFHIPPALADHQLTACPNPRDDPPKCALIVLKTTQSTTRAAQFIKNSNIVRYSAHQVIEYIIILIPKPLMYKVAIHLIALFLINSLLKRKLTLRHIQNTS
ncbi:Hypothetical protein CINCED_3A018841 [Cinara cedri]|uniref:Uncharacterized protein n=1 Tax=Cinara cedri TaxID=506608 RepID=A0A5E4N5E1_9HEMI|nr:Hypothetical protein CINCED_3A018841 [Cinara cedri]